MIKQSKIFEVFTDEKRIYTKNLAKGKRVYGERIVKDKGTEYREWNPKKSKLGAMIKKGSPNIGIRKNDVVLYLGAASGTTVSHVSDMIQEGIVFAVEFSPLVTRDLVFLAEDRKNIAPILATAHDIESFQDRISMVDVVFQDISQKNQADIFLKNCKKFLKKDGYALLSLKAKSIDITRKPKAIFNEVRRQLEKELIIIDSRTLEPYELDHMMFVCKKR
jgi:fibrillarin-like pre-rRNA processing protein